MVERHRLGLELKPPSTEGRHQLPRSVRRGRVSLYTEKRAGQQAERLHRIGDGDQRVEGRDRPVPGQRAQRIAGRARPAAMQDLIRAAQETAV
jgi:hypothetical protein